MTKTLFLYSSKGGVGKSTIACNLAFNLHLLGFKVGILDADFKTPSISNLIYGLELDKKPFINNFIIEPARYSNMLIQSTGFFNGKEMSFWPDDYIEGAMWQLFNEKDWRDLDFLIVDMPPCIETIHSYLCSFFIDAKVIFVSTESQLSLEDCLKGISFMNDLEMNILGFIINISSLICPECNKKIKIFEDRKLELGYEIIGDVPLSKNIIKYTEMGIPFVLAKENFYEKTIFSKLTKKVISKFYEKAN